MKMAFLVFALLITSFTFTASHPAKAQDEGLDLDMMNIEGDLEAPTNQAAQSERLKKMRAALEKRNEILIRRKIEQLRVKQEIEMMRQIQRAMNKTMKELDTI